MRTGLAAITSGVLLTLSLPPFGCASLIWVALVPLLIITKCTHGIIRPFSYGTTAAVILFVGAGYGLLPYDPPLAILYPIALSLLVGTVFAVQAIFLQRGLPRWLGVLAVWSPRYKDGRFVR